MDILDVKNDDDVPGHDDDLELVRETFADPDDNYIHVLGLRIPKLWWVLWGPGEEDKKIRSDDRLKIDFCICACCKDIRAVLLVPKTSVK